MFRLATSDDRDSILIFLEKYWDRNHVYVRNPGLFEFDFRSDAALNFGVIELDESIEGVFGFFYYNSFGCPDIGGMLWQVSPTAQSKYPLAGLKLRQFVLEAIPHRFYGAGGAGVQTKPIYDSIDMQWIAFDHFFGILKKGVTPSFVKFPFVVDCIESPPAKIIQIDKIDALLDIDEEIFLHQTPRKDHEYLVRRYWGHPFRSYVFWLVQARGKQALVVARVQDVGAERILRIIDYVGPAQIAAQSISNVLANENHRSNVSAVDFVCSGFDPDSFRKLGFICVDFHDANTVVPSHYDPIELRSIQSYGIADRGYKNVVMVKGNGDMDRPNLIQGC